MRGAAGVIIGVLATIALLAISIQRVDALPTVSEDRAPFGGLNGESFYARAIGDQVWVGGDYTLAFDPDHTTSYPRANLAVFDFNTGTVLPFTADTDDKVLEIESDDATTVWISGQFNEVRGETRYHIAAFDLFGGAFSSTFSGSANNDINAMLLHNGWLYLGGEFTRYNNEDRLHLVRVDPVTGDVDPNFVPNPDGDVRDLAAVGDRVYAAGLFEQVGVAPNEVDRRWIAGFDTATGLPAGPDFFVPPLCCGENQFKAGFDSVDVSTDGSFLFTGDRRNFARKWNITTGNQIWSQEAEGDIQTLAADASDVFLGFHDGWDAKGDERLLVSIDANTGARTTAWAPTMDSFLGTWDIELAAGAVIAVGDFTEVNGVSSPHLAVFLPPNWPGADPIDWPAADPGDVNCDFSTGIGDALAILQYTVGLRAAATSCPIDPTTELNIESGDVNGDLAVTVGDALLVVQCTVSIPNVLCP